MNREPLGLIGRFIVDALADRGALSKTALLSSNYLAMKTKSLYFREEVRAFVVVLAPFPRCLRVGADLRQPRLGWNLRGMPDTDYP